MCIPAAFLARFTRKVFGVKGLPLEKACMKYYYKMERKLLGLRSDDEK